MFRRGNGVSFRSIHHHDATSGGRFNIDVIHPDPGPANHFQFVGGGNNLAGYFGGTADCQAIILADDRCQFLRGHTNLDIHFKLGKLFKNFQPLGGHFITD